eukprot:scaffold252836_cov12-Tisochrysis_lutea.AAC.1
METLNASSAPPKFVFPYPHAHTGSFYSQEIALKGKLALTVFVSAQKRYKLICMAPGTTPTHSK